MYIIDASADEPIMLIDKHIGYNEVDGYGIDGSEFAKELLWLDSMGKKTIDIWINSPGGSVMEGYNIYNAMLKSKAKVNTRCVGIAASISAVLFQAGRERVMCDYGILMYHEPFGSDDNEMLRKFSDSICKMICSRSGMDEATCAAMMKRETFMNADEALSAKLCDRIEASSDYNKKRITAVAVENNTAGYWKEAGAVLNQLFKTEIVMPDFSKIANKLELVPEANENAIAGAIDRILNRASTAENALTTVRNELATANGTITTLTETVNKLTGEKKVAEDAAKKVTAETMVRGFATKGAIQNKVEVVNAWVDRAATDFEGTKSLLETLPVNKVANKINDGTDTGNPTADKDRLENEAANAMLAIQNKLLGIK